VSRFTTRPAAENRIIREEKIMGTIDVIGSQLDVVSIVSQLMLLERQPVYRMEDQIASMQKKVTAYQALNTRLSALANNVNMMLYGSTTAPFVKPGTFDLRMATSVFTSRTAKSSNENVLTASATGTASAGSYSITVNNLAKAQASISGGIADLDGDIGAISGTITTIGGKTLAINLDIVPKTATFTSEFSGSGAIGYEGAITLTSNNGASVSVDVETSDTLADVANKINTAVSDYNDANVDPAKNIDITANITGGKLEIFSTIPGTANAFTVKVDDDEENAGLREQLGISLTQAAANNGNTLRGLQQAINEAAARESAAINASIMYDGTDYRLMVSSKETGLANAFSIDLNSSTLSTLGFTNSQEADDARLAINGVVVTSSTNTVKNAIEGVTINLKGETKLGETVQLDLGVNNDAIVSAVKEIVSAYNAVSSYINSQFNYTTTNSTDSVGRQQVSVSGGVLAGDATLRSIQSSLQSIVSGGIPSGENYALRSIGQVGLSYDKDGALTLDEAKLREALDNDFDAVAGFFLGYDKTVVGDDGFESVQRIGGMLTNMGEALKGLTDPLKNPVKSALDGINSNIRNLQQSIEAYELRLQVKEDLLFAQFTAADEALRMMRVTLGSITNSLASLTNSNNK